MQDPGDNPAVLYGYGGMGISMTPYFGSPETPFFDAGSIYAGANLRGDHYYTSSIHLAGEGDSNGGILNGRPDHPARKPLSRHPLRHRRIRHALLRTRAQWHRQLH